MLSGKRFVVWSVLLSFVFTGLPPVRAQVLPFSGQMVAAHSAFNPPVLKGIKVYPDNPLRFDFILDKGDQVSDDDRLQTDTPRLIKYFLASLTVPEKDLWVNLSPYEKDRIVPEAFGQTEMGRDLLAQDYLLKQIMASLLYPESRTGKTFWKKIYTLAQEKYGTTNIPVDTFNKVWILPDKAVVYENGKAGVAYVTQSRLKVMLESDYLAQQKNAVKESEDETSRIAREVMRAVVIPELEREVNEGKSFARLRQVYQSLILAAWYRKKVRQSLLSAVYVDRRKTEGINIADPKEAGRIWEQYVESFRKGAYNFVREERDAFTDDVLPRKYFAGGMTMDLAQVLNEVHDFAEVPGNAPHSSELLQIRLAAVDFTGHLIQQKYPTMAEADKSMNTARRWEIVGELPVISRIVSRLARERSSESGEVVFQNEAGRKYSMRLQWSFQGEDIDSERVLLELVYNGRKIFECEYHYNLANEKIVFIKLGDIKLVQPDLKGLYRYLFQIFSSGADVVKADITNIQTNKAIRLGTEPDFLSKRLPFAVSLFNLTFIARARGGMQEWVTIRNGVNDFSFESYRISSVGDEFSSDVQKAFNEAFQAEKAWIVPDEFSETGLLSERALERASFFNLGVEDISSARLLYSRTKVSELADRFQGLKKKVEIVMWKDRKRAELLASLVSALGQQSDRLYAIAEEIEHLQTVRLKSVPPEPFEYNLNAKGGIDLDSGKLDLETRNSGTGIDFQLDLAMLEQMKNAAGFVPVIIGVQPVGDLRFFLGSQAQDSLETESG